MMAIKGLVTMQSALFDHRDLEMINGWAEPDLTSKLTRYKKTVVLIAVFIAFGFVNTLKTQNMESNIFLLGSRGSAEWFTGEVYIQGLINPDEMENLYSVGQVTFMPGGRTYWHTHPIGQTLLVLEGQGWYQEHGKPAQKLVKGSIVAIPKDVEHWHGASAGAKLVHIAISNMENGNCVTWLSPVTDKEYCTVNDTAKE